LSADLEVVVLDLEPHRMEGAYHLLRQRMIQFRSTIISSQLERDMDSHVELPVADMVMVEMKKKKKTTTTTRK
jgi:hypothetical protein